MDGRLYALSPDGIVTWKVVDGGPVVAVGRDGRIYAGSSAFDPKNGKRTAEFPNSVAVLGNDDTIFVQHEGIFAFDFRGTIKWNSSAVAETPVVAGNDGDIYFGSRSTYAVRDPVTGVPKYVPPPPGAPRYRVVALDPRSGSIRWSFSVRGKISAVVRGHEGTICAGSYDGHVYALDPDTGALRWRFWAGGKWGEMPVHALAVGSDGTIYVGAGSYVEAIRPPSRIVQKTNASTGTRIIAPVAK